MFARIGIGITIAAAFFGYAQYDKATNYVQVSASVTDVEQLCYLKKRGYKTTTTTDAGPCDVMREINATHPEYKNYNLVKTTFVEYEYQSPADGNYYISYHEQERHKNGTKIEYGDTLVVLAHLEEPETTQED